MSVSWYSITIPFTIDAFTELCYVYVCSLKQIYSDSFIVFAGSAKNNEGTSHIISEIITHPNYTITSRLAVGLVKFINDIALLKLEEPIHLDGIMTMPICLSAQWHLDTHFRRCYVTGWGITHPEVLGICFYFVKICG